MVLSYIVFCLICLHIIILAFAIVNTIKEDFNQHMAEEKTEQEEDSSYVLMTLRQNFDMVRQDADGNYIPLSPVNLPDHAYMCRSMISEAHFP